MLLHLTSSFEAVAFQINFTLFFYIKFVTSLAPDVKFFPPPLVAALKTATANAAVSSSFEMKKYEMWRELLVTRSSFRSPPPSSHLCSRGINIQEEDKDDSGGELSCKDGQ